MSGPRLRVSVLLVSMALAASCTTQRYRGTDPADAPDSGVGIDAEPFDSGSSEDTGAQVDTGSGIPTGGLLSRLDRVHLYLNLGDSQAAGYNASGRYGWAKLLYENRNRPDYDGHDLHSYFAAATMTDQAQSGWTSGDVLMRLRSTINSLPAGVDGDDTVVTLGCGGNDFNDNINTIIARSSTESAARDLTSNYNEIFSLLKGRYQDSARGRELVVLSTNVYDPTDGTGNVPAEFNDGFCETIHNPLFSDSMRQDALNNLSYFNEQIAAATESNGGYLVDHAAIFMGHGMTSGAARWLDGDCTHPIDEGHHNQRRLMWQFLTSELFGAPWS